VKAAPVVLLNGVAVTGEQTLKRFEALVAAAVSKSSGTR